MLFGGMIFSGFRWSFVYGEMLEIMVIGMGFGLNNLLFGLKRMDLSLELHLLSIFIFSFGSRGGAIWNTHVFYAIQIHAS